MKKIAKKVRKTLDSLVEDGIFTFSSDLCGLCAIGSWFLVKKLREKGYNAELYISEAGNHVWCQVGKTVIDVTVTQFGHREKIYLGKSSPRCYYYKGQKVKWPKDFKCWDRYQSPLNRTNLKAIEERYKQI